MNENEKFDLMVIGAGTGGGGGLYPCAKAGWKVAIVDSLPYGGTCALRGCEPKKMLVAVTEGIDWSDRMSGNGLQNDNMSIDWAKMIAFKRTFTDGIPKRLEHGLEKMGVVTLHDTARFIAPGVVQVGDRELHAKYFHIATGARPLTSDIPGRSLA